MNACNIGRPQERAMATSLQPSFSAVLFPGNKLNCRFSRGDDVSVEVLHGLVRVARSSVECAAARAKF